MKLISIFSILFVSICVMTDHANGKEDGSVGLRVSLLSSAKVVQGEPVMLTVRIENTSQERRSFVVPEIRRFGPKTILFHIASTNAEIFEEVQYPDIYVGGMKNMPPWPLPVQQLEKGKTVEFSFMLMYDFPVAAKRKQLFWKPGKCKIEVTVFAPKNEPQESKEMPYDGDKTPITSAPLSVEIVPPDNAQDIAALAQLQELPDEYLLYAPETFKADTHAEAIRKIANYFQQFSTTRYGRYCALPLGVALKAGVPNIDREKVKAMLESITLEKDFPLKREATVVLDKVKELENRVEKLKQTKP